MTAGTSRRGWPPSDPAARRSHADADRATLAVGDQIADTYEITSSLGIGASGEVYGAWHLLQPWHSTLGMMRYAAAAHGSASPGLGERLPWNGQNGGTGLLRRGSLDIPESANGATCRAYPLGMVNILAIIVR